MGTMTSSKGKRGGLLAECYGDWEVQDRAERASDGRVLCKCLLCGTERRVQRWTLTGGYSESCGCTSGAYLLDSEWNTEELAPAHSTSVYPGARFGRWTVISEILPTHKHTASCRARDCDRPARNNKSVECACSCPDRTDCDCPDRTECKAPESHRPVKVVAVEKLLNKKSRSCGCLKNDAGRDVQQRAHAH